MLSIYRLVSTRIGDGTSALFEHTVNIVVTQRVDLTAQICGPGGEAAERRLVGKRMCVFGFKQSCQPHSS
jgi:hypothetical protein